MNVLPKSLALLATTGCLAVLPARAGYDFGPWPESAAPREVGKRVAERFLAEDYRLSGREHKVFHYAETCTWYARLRITGDLHGQVPVLGCASALPR